MKAAYAILFGLLGLTPALGQNQLSFSKSLFFQLSGDVVPGGPLNTVDTIHVTVPIGYTWKIENASCSSHYNDSHKGAFRDCGIDLNGVMIVGTEDGGLFGMPPIWLPSGTYVIGLHAMPPPPTDWKADGFVSAIEFRIDP